MSMKVKLFGVVGALVLFGAATSAEARRHEWSDDSGWEDSDSRQMRRRYRSHEASARRYEWSEDRDEAAPRRAHRKHRQHRQARKPGAKPAVKQADLGSHRAVGPRPGAWCGWWMRTQKGGGPEYNLAWNWSRRGQPSEPKVGAVVVWRHHVGEITGRAKNGQWIVRSGNDGGRVRERPRSVAGAVFRML
ncbi:MAG: hypothetical protein ABW200_07035 [Hyphomicrobiaceae bacterium]|jgi:hypothetical protein